MLIKDVTHGADIPHVISSLRISLAAVVMG
jgi:hypothetical protein